VKSITYFRNRNSVLEREDPVKTASSLLNLEIHKSFFCKENLGALFLDIKAANDNVIPSLLFDIINNLKISM